MDAGAHLASIIRILELYMPLHSDKLPPKGHASLLKEGPFAGVKFPNISAKANGLFIFRELLHSFLITHPHLDHVSGLGINTPALEFGREAKAIVALPSVIDAIKNHIFNDSIWPNLSDEDHGVGLVTYRRLIEGGNPRLGLGEARGYVNVCDGLATKCWGVTHGKCLKQSHSLSHHQHGESSSGYFHSLNGMGPGDGYSFSRRMSRVSDDYAHISSLQPTQIRDVSLIGAQAHQQRPTTPGAAYSASSHDTNFQPVESSAFFIRNDVTGQEILIFGDIEPDNVSMHPRNHIVWDDAAPKFVAGNLKAIFIECSYDDSVQDADLYGHMCPRHLITELTFLAQRVQTMRKLNQLRMDFDEQEEDGRNDVQDTKLALHRSRTMIELQDPPSPRMMKRKRKRAATENSEGYDEMAREVLLEEIARKNRSISSSQGKTVHVAESTFTRCSKTKSPARETKASGERDGSLSDDTLTLEKGAKDGTRGRERPSMSPPLRRARPLDRSPRQTSLTADKAGKLDIIPPAQVPPVAAPGAGTSGSANMTLAQATATSTGATEGNASVSGAVASESKSAKRFLDNALKGLTVHIIHVKDTLTDGPSCGDVVLSQLRNRGAEAGLGVEWNVTTCGEEVWI